MVWVRGFELQNLEKWDKTKKNEISVTLKNSRFSSLDQNDLQPNETLIAVKIAVFSHAF